MKPASFFRRSAAVFYDYLLGIALAVISHCVICIFLIFLSFLGFLSALQNPDGLVEFLSCHWLAHWFAVGGIVSGFFVWFWRHGGQTVGMKAWQIKLQNRNGSTINFQQAMLRICFSFMGLGNLLILFNPQKLALQDLLSNSQMVSLKNDKAN